MSTASPVESGRAIGNIQAAIDTLNHAGRATGRVARRRHGTSYSLLRAAAKGASALVTGRMTRTGVRGIDGPAESVQGRTHAREMGLLSLAALTFATMKDAQAADSNDTFLDEDSISYKDLAHGSFTLRTNEPVPRYLTVEDPGETIELTRSGSTISVNQFANSTARMEELQAAQQEAYANFEKGPGPGGSGTTPFSDTLPAQPINFIQPGEPAELNSLPALPAVETRAEFIFIPALAPPPPTPTLTLALGSGPTETDTVVFDTFAATSGTFQASSSNGGATLTYGINGGSPGNTVLNGVTYDVSQTHDFGTLYVNSTSGAYTFVPDDGAINALKEPATENFVVTVSDGTMSASQTFAIEIDGVNDDAIIAGDVTGSLGEAAGVAGFARFAATHAPAPRTATGTLTSTDVDDAANAFAAVDQPTASDGGYGTFTMTADGTWTYLLDDSNSTVQALNVGDVLTDTFTVTSVDGTEQVVTIVIGGRNDPAVISGDTAGLVVEAACKDPGIPTATGTLTSTDVDNASDSFKPIKCRESDGGYGTFTMTADGVWTYTLDNDNCAVQALDDCDTLTDTFTVTSEDGTEQVITITIQGADDGHGHHHKNSDHEEWTYKTSVASDSPEVVATLANDADTSETPVSIVATDIQPTVVQPKDAGTTEASATEVRTSAAMETSFAVAPATADSFQFKDLSTGSPALDALILGDVGCIQTLISSLVSAQDASDIVEAIQAFESCLVQHASDFFAAISEGSPVTSHTSHELMV